MKSMAKYQIIGFDFTTESSKFLGYDGDDIPNVYKIHNLTFYVKDLENNFFLLKSPEREKLFLIDEHIGGHILVENPQYALVGKLEKCEQFPITPKYVSTESITMDESDIRPTAGVYYYPINRNILLKDFGFK